MISNQYKPMVMAMALNHFDLVKIKSSKINYVQELTKNYVGNKNYR